MISVASFSCFSLAALSEFFCSSDYNFQIKKKSGHRALTDAFCAS